MTELFTGTGIAHCIMLYAVVIAIGLFLGRYKFKGVSLGSTWILFVGIVFSHFGLRVDPGTLAFVKDFGLILFVFTIGLQVGPGFFTSFKKGGVKLNLLALTMVALTVFVTIGLNAVTGGDLKVMTGVMSGAVTNTPGLGAAQQALSAEESSLLASAYAVAYPLGVIAVIVLIIFAKSIFKIDLSKEKAALEAEEGGSEGARRMHCEVENPAIFGLKIKDVISKQEDEKYVISRLMRGREIIVPGPDTVLMQGDKLLIVTNPSMVDAIRIIFGKEIPMHLTDWDKLGDAVVTRRLAITRSSLTGKHLKDLNIRANYGVTITRVVRAGVELVARPNLILEMGDGLQVVGTESAIGDVAKLVGNRPQSLTKPNLVPIFFGIAVGVIFGSIPLAIPGIPSAVKLGLAGGPLIIAILLGHFGPKFKITTYTTLSANMMVREIGISLFMASVGLGAGESFVASIVNGGYMWIIYGLIITSIPIIIIMLLSRLVLKLNFYQLCGLVAGASTNPASLAFSQEMYGTDYPSVNYATVYPLTMFLRVLAAQVLVMLAL